MRMIFITLGMFISISCGEQGLKPTGETQLAVNDNSETVKNSADNSSNSEFATTILLQSEDNLPACGEDIQGQLAFIINTDKLKTCDSETWVDISIGGQATDEFAETGF